MESKRRARFSEQVEGILNMQIANEIRNSFIYRSMANCMEYNGFDGAVKLYKKHSDEERDHAERVIKYMQDRDCLPKIPSVEAPQKEYESIKDIILKTDEVEKKTSEEWRKISLMALQEKDMLTFEMSQWFLNEQTQEESESNYWVNRMQMLEKTGAPLYYLDEEMGDKA